MRLPQLAINNGPFVLVVIALLVLMGAASFYTMPWWEDPVVRLPVTQVVAVYPGVEAKTVETEVADPIEARLSEVEDIKEVRTRITEGLAVLTVEAYYSVDVDEKSDEIIAAVNNIRGQLPDELRHLEMNQIKANDVSIYQLAVMGEGYGKSGLFEHTDALKTRLENVDGVRGAEIMGMPDELVRVNLDLGALREHGLTIERIQQQLQTENMIVPGGKLAMQSRSFGVETSGAFKDLATLRRLPLLRKGPHVLRLQDVATVHKAYEADDYITRYNQRPCLFLNVTLKSDYNIADVTQRVRSTVDDYRATAPESLELTEAFVQAPFVQDRVAGFFVNLLQGILLVGLMIFLFMGMRAAGIMVLVIPTAIMMAIIVLDTTGFALQQISIAGLVIALGLLVDNGIVVVENINRFRLEGYPLRQAAAKATAEVGWAIVSATATTVMAFIPLTQIGGGAGEFLKSLPLIIIYVLIASLLLALTFNPLLSSRLLGGRLMRLNQWTLGSVQRFRDKVYTPLVRAALRRPWVTLGIAIGTLVGAIYLFPYVGVSFFPTADKPIYLINIKTPEGSSQARTERAVRYVESILDTSDYVKHYMANVGGANPQIYYNRHPPEPADNVGQVVGMLKPFEPGRFYRKLGSLRERFSDYPGARITLKELKNGAPVQAPIELKILGPNIDTLRHYARKLERIVAEHDQTLNVRNKQAFNIPKLQVEPNRERAALSGVPIANVDRAVRTSVTGLRVGEVNLAGEDETRRLELHLAGDSARDLNWLSYVHTGNAQNKPVPLSQVAQAEFSAALPAIDHYNKRRAATVLAAVRLPNETAAINAEIMERARATIDLPQGYDWFVGGEAERQGDAFGDLGYALGFALLGIFAILVLQFRSMSQPFIVLSAIPLAFSGSIVALFLSGYSFSFFAFVGFVSLVGIVVNNAIILVDYTNQLLRTGYAKYDALLQATKVRFTPILLTTLTTILGLVPLTATNTNLWTPLGWTIIGGMLSSTALTLLIVPILYNWFTQEPEAAAPAEAPATDAVTA
jgi:multidrug efflux pump subunit AcrB